MGKGTRHIETVRETENDPPMPNSKFVNGLSAGKSKKKEKKVLKKVKLRAQKEASVATQQEDVVGASPLKRLQKVHKKKKKRRKMGCPIIVEDTVGEYPSIPVPTPLRQASTDQYAVTTVSMETFHVGKEKRHKKALKKAQITIAECIDPSQKKPVENCTETRLTDVPFEEAMEQAVETCISEDDTINQPAVETSLDLKEPADEDVPSNYLHGETHLNNDRVPSMNESTQEISGRKLPRFYSFRNKVLTIIEPDCKFCFHGKLRVRVLYGAVRIYGFSLNSSTTRTPLSIYSPRAYSPISIEPTESEIHDRDITNVWVSLGEKSTDQQLAKSLQSDIENVDDGWAIVELENVDNALTTFLASHCPFRLFPRIDDLSNHSWRDPRRAEIVLQANLRSVDPCKQLTIGSRGIDDLADSICYDWETKGTSRTIIAGGKSVGKSTTARYIVNKLLAKSRAVVFIDLDPGQAEFTPAGCISLNVVEEPLLGPNFTHLKAPYYQLYVGSSDVTRCLAHYVDGAKKLVDRIGEDTRLSHLPVVVNTMGFCKGIGSDIISYVIKVVAATDVIQILSRRSKNNFENPLSRPVVDQNRGWMSWTKETIEKPSRHRLHVIYSEAETGSGTAESWNLEPHQQRDLVMLSYLSQIVANNRPPSARWRERTLTLSINAVPPYTVPFSGMSVSLPGSFVSQVLSVMNGNIVALCGIDVEPTEESNSEENVTVGYPTVLIRSPLATCYGFGILRGVDMEREQLFLNTPLSAAHMEHVNCLIGSVNLPNSLMQFNQQGAPYVGNEYDLPTSREPRRGYVRTRFQADN